LLKEKCYSKRSIFFLQTFLVQSIFDLASMLR